MQNRYKKSEKLGQKFQPSPYIVPSGSSKDLRTEREARVYGWDGWMGWDGISKVSFNFLHIQICWQLGCALTKYMFKVCHQLSYGFEILLSSWGWGNTIFEITIFTWLFKYLGPNLSFFFLFFCAFFHFDEKFKNLFYHAKLKKVGVTFFFVFIEIIRFFIQTCLNLSPPPSTPTQSPTPPLTPRLI